MAEESIDVLIIGAGPSGCVAAAFLHKHGIKIKVVEKNFFPRFVIGESLLPRCMDHFAEVDLFDILDQQNYEIKRGARFLKDGKTCIFDFSEKHGEGWDWTWQVPRAHFDNVLTKDLLRKGVDIQFGVEVTDIAFDENGKSRTSVVDSEGKQLSIEANFVIDSSGFGRVLPRFLGLDKPSSLPNYSSIFSHVKDVNRPTGFEGTLITFDVLSEQSWLWVIPFSDGNTSIGFVGPTETIETLQGINSDKLKSIVLRSDHYKNRFEGVDFLFEPNLIKNYSKSVSTLYGKGFALTGNSSEFLDPVFSSGVTFATESGLMAAKLVTKELNGQIVDWEKEFSEYMREGVEVFSTYVKEWYSGNLQKIFFHSDNNPEIKKQICAVLAGYVWDQSNPFVRNHKRLVKAVAHVIDLKNGK